MEEIKVGLTDKEKFILISVIEGVDTVEELYNYIWSKGLGSAKRTMLLSLTTGIIELNTELKGINYTIEFESCHQRKIINNTTSVMMNNVNTCYQVGRVLTLVLMK